MPKENIRYAVSIRKGDAVRVMAGRDRGKTGRVLSVNPVTRKVTVEHANIVKRHTRPNPAKNIKGGIVEREGPMDISNVLIVCPGCSKHTRVGQHVERDPKTNQVTAKYRICRRCGVSLDR